MYDRPASAADWMRLRHTVEDTVRDLKHARAQRAAGSLFAQQLRKVRLSGQLRRIERRIGERIANGGR